MARDTGPKNRLARREGADLGLKTVGSNAHASLLKRLAIPPGMHGQKRMRRLSDYGKQLREKQKAKRIYGVLERQFKKYYERAAKIKGATGPTLLRFLETRLDNVIYKLGFAPTRASARQLVAHGNVIVDGQKMTIPSCEVKPGNVITLKQKAFEIPAIKKLISNKSLNIVSWLSKKGPVGRVERLPDGKDFEENIDEQLIVEYYSR